MKTGQARQGGKHAGYLALLMIGNRDQRVCVVERGAQSTSIFGTPDAMTPSKIYKFISGIPQTRLATTYENPPKTGERHRMST